MKRIAMAMVAVLMMVTLLVTASADNFVNSVAQVGKPVLQGNPEIAQGIFLVLTSYKDRASLPDGGADMEAAYNLINGASSLDALNSGLKTAADALGVDVADLVVTDLFDLSLVNDAGDFLLDKEKLAEYAPITVSLKADLLDTFVGLLHYVDGQFVIVDNAKVVNGTLVFTVDTLSPFAIVVDSEGGANQGGSSTEPGTSDTPSPDTGDAAPFGYAVVLAVAALIGCVLFVRRKQTAE